MDLEKVRDAPLPPLRSFPTTCPLLQLSAAQSDLDSLAKSALLLHPQPAAAAAEEASRAAAADDRDRRRGGPRTGGAAVAAEDDPLL